MIMIRFVIAIMVFSVAIVICFNHGFTASPRGRIQQAMRIRPAPRKGSDEEQKHKAGTKLSHLEES